VELAQPQTASRSSRLSQSDRRGPHRIPENVTLVRLPPYAPELNPIENVWEYLRGNKLAITVFDDYDDIVDKTCDAWNFFEKDPTRIASITTRTWATVSI
jgi:transposase